MNVNDFVQYTITRLNTEQGFRVFEDEFPEFNSREFRLGVLNKLFALDKNYSDNSSSFSRMDGFYWGFRCNKPGHENTPLNKYPCMKAKPNSGKEHIWT